jgi:hypothetical protein
MIRLFRPALRSDSGLPWFGQFCDSIEDNMRRNSIDPRLDFELTDDTTLTIRAKGSDGVTRSATITLS